MKQYQKRLRAYKGELPNNGAQANWINRNAQKNNQQLSRSDLRRKISRDRNYEEPITCYRCQELGHKSNECINIKVPRERPYPRYANGFRRSRSGYYSGNSRRNSPRRFRENGDFKRGRINAVEETQSEDEESNSGSYQRSSSESEERTLMNNLSMARSKKGKTVKALIFPFIINNKINNMEIDTGACYTIISIVFSIVWKKLQTFLSTQKKKF